MNFKKIFSTLLSALTVFSVSSFCSIFASEIEDAEKLYVEIKNFLKINKDVLPEEFDNVCARYISESNNNATLNDTENGKSENIIILYRGFSNKKYAEEFKRGKYFTSVWNVRGSGIYTTTSLDCAKSYSDEKVPETLVKMEMNANTAKILENDYLEKLKKLIIKNHNEEFGEFDSKIKEDYIYDSLSDYLNEAFKETYKKCEELLNLHLSDEDYLKQEEKLLKGTLAQVEKDPVYQELRAKRKKYYKTNKSCVWFNSGLLTKLLGYDALHSIDSLREFVDSKEEEYLVVAPCALNTLE